MLTHFDEAEVLCRVAGLFLQHQQTGTIHTPKLGQGKESVGVGITQDKLGLMTLTIMMTK